jgi:methyl-accepting chemotaxis protein
MKTMSILVKVNAVVTSVALLFVVFAGGIQFSTYRNTNLLAEVSRNYDVLDKFVIPLINFAKSLELDVSQVQQYLSDISATRGQDGLDTGFQEAEESAESFKKNIAEVRRLAEQIRNRELIDSVNQLAANFDPYYEIGKEMAAAYMKEGPAGGNPKMPDFDKQADAMRDELTKVIDLSRTISEQSRAKTSTSMGTLGESVNFERAAAFVFAGLAVLFAIVVAFVLNSSVSRPLGAMANAMAELGRGNFNVELPGLDRRDEIGVMAHSVQAFKVKAEEKVRLEAEERAARERAAVEEKRTREEHEAAERAAAVEHEEAASKAAIHDVLKKFESAVGGIIGAVSAASTELETTAGILTEAAEETQRLSTAVVSASEHASGNVQTVASATEEMTSSVHEISRQVHESSRIAGEAVRQAETTDVRINELSKAATRIGDVVNLTTAIAEQTNLLALNATIEAARAGDAGRGFAVVAQEVKALAAQTAKATEEIGSQIVGMQTATRESVAAIKEISGTIGKISEIASAIAAAINEQGAATQEIARNVGEAAEGTSKVTTSITDVSQHASETGQTSTHMLSSAQSLSAQANLLKTEMDKFLDTIRSGLGNRRKADDPNYAGMERRAGHGQRNRMNVKRAV